MGEIFEPVFAGDGAQRLVDVVEWIALHLCCADCNSVGQYRPCSLVKEVYFVFIKSFLDFILKKFGPCQTTDEEELQF